jgi:hypothetical protein
MSNSLRSDGNRSCRVRWAKQNVEALASPFVNILAPHTGHSSQLFSGANAAVFKEARERVYPTPLIFGGMPQKFETDPAREQ